MTIKIILIYLFCFGLSISAFADNKKNRSKFKTERVSAFENSTFKPKPNDASGGTKDGLPADPGTGGSGGSGNPIPISGGSLLLVGGLISYTILRKKYKKDA